MAEPLILEDEDLPDDVKVLRRLPKSSNEEWIVGINEFRGNNYVQVRVYYRDEKDNDKYYHLHNNKCRLYQWYKL